MTVCMPINPDMINPYVKLHGRYLLLSQVSCHEGDALCTSQEAIALLGKQADVAAFSYLLRLGIWCEPGLL